MKSGIASYSNKIRGGKGGGEEDVCVCERERYSHSVQT